jgi:hypothetical protein
MSTLSIDIALFCSYPLVSLIFLLEKSMNPYRIITDGKWFKIQEQTGWIWKRWVNWRDPRALMRVPFPTSTLQRNRFATEEEAEDLVRKLCGAGRDEWQVVKTFNTGLDDVLWSRPAPAPAPVPSTPPPPPSK